MKKLLALCVAAGLLAVLTGCPTPSSSNSKTDKGSAKDTKETKETKDTKDTKEIKPVKEGKIEFDTIAPVTVDAGKSTDVTIKIKRTDSEGDVTVTFKAPDDSKLTFDPKEVALKGKDVEGKVKVTAGDVKKDFDVEATAKGKDVKDATTKFKVTVK